MDDKRFHIECVILKYKHPNMAFRMVENALIRKFLLVHFGFDGFKRLCVCVKLFGQITMCNVSHDLLCGKFFHGSVGVRQPDLVDVMQHVFARLAVVFSVALQDLVTMRRVFERDERRVRLFL